MKYLYEKLNITCKVNQYRISGKVIIVNIGNEIKLQNEITKNKYKLKKKKFFVQNDLIQKERKVQKRFNSQKKYKYKKIRINGG